MAEKSYTKLSLALLDEIVVCGQCGALFLAVGWSNQTHLAWHAAQASRALDGEQ